jgi:lysophospholipase L1-like esterase
VSETALLPSPAARWKAALAALLAGPAFLLMDTGIALARGWEPRAGLPRVVIGASLLAVLGVGVLAAVPAGRRFLARRWAAVVVVTVSLALGWAAAELAARAFPELLGGRFAHSRGPGVQRTFRPDPRWVSGIAGPSRYTTNSLGIRGGPPPDGAYRLLCLGGSTTECTYLDDAETWPHLLMESLNGRGRRVWVGNLGISGYTSFEHLDFLERSPLPEELDAAILLMGVNDFVRFLNGSLERGPRPLWRRTALASAALAVHRRGFLRRLLHEVEDETGANLEERRRARLRSEGGARLPELAPALREYGDRIEGLARACRRRGLRCVFLTQPTLWREGLGPRARASLWMGSDAGGRFLPPGELRRGLDLYNRTLLAACVRLGLECADLGSLNGREDLFYDDCHFTEAGAREVARIVAAALEGRR